MQVLRDGYAGELDCEFVAVWEDERHDSLKKRFVYQSTENHDELKMSYFQRTGRVGVLSGVKAEMALGAA
ncbi:hypothetical protein V5F34_23855 [Xanthobacter autotrophicus]|uniref:hypothetical protein n=1 Tax=Xanthobacter autotrophicus TaxID=280 RepID=UPI0037297AD5